MLILLLVEMVFKMLNQRVIKYTIITKDIQHMNREDNTKENNHYCLQKVFNTIMNTMPYLNFFHSKNMLLFLTRLPISYQRMYTRLEIDSRLASALLLEY